MAIDQSAEIIRQLAILGEQITGVRRDLERQDQASAEEGEESHRSRRELYEKVNTVAADIAMVKGDVKVAGLVAAQARDGVAELKATVEKAAPTIADMENAKKVGSWLLGGGAAAAITAGIAAVAWGEAIKGWLAHWLGIK